MIWGTVSKIVCHSQATPDLLAYLHHLIHFGHNRRLRRSLVNIPLSLCFRFHFALIFCVCLNKLFYVAYLLVAIIWSVSHFFTTVIQRLDDFVSRYFVCAKCSARCKIRSFFGRSVILSSLLLFRWLTLCIC